MTYVGISERSFSDDHERRQRRACNKKKSLIRRAKLLAKSEDWKVAGQELASLHQRWKAAGSAGREHDDKLWAAFRALTIEFHERRQRHFAELNRLAKQRASTKQQLISEAERLDIKGEVAIDAGRPRKSHKCDNFVPITLRGLKSALAVVSCSTCRPATPPSATPAQTA